MAEEHHIDLAVACEDGCLVWGDAQLVTTAITNLIGNAISYSDPGTRVAVSVRRGSDDLVDIAVTDQGLGIAPEEQERIFERFYRVDTARSRSTGGTGLGLAIVKHVVDNHGGTVSVWSQPGRGSTFTIRLPAAHGGAVRPLDSAGAGGVSVAAAPPPADTSADSTAPSPTTPAVGMHLPADASTSVSAGVRTSPKGLS